MNKLNAFVYELEAKIPQLEKENKAISNGSVGWHIEHTLLTINLITKALEASDPKQYKWKFNFIRILILTLKYIPRGRAKAPEVVRPRGEFNEESLRIRAEKTRNYIEELAALSNDSFFEHPYFGHMKRKTTIRFLEIHTHHHLKIIRDILK